MRRYTEAVYEKYDIFLFDADGTLFNFDKAEVNAFTAMCGNYGIAYMETILQNYREISAELWDSFEKGIITSKELQESRFARLFDYLGVYHDAMEFNRKYLRELGKGAFLIDGALKICEYIASRNKKIYIITNGITVTQTSRLNNSRIKNFVSDLFVSESVGFQKPHISYFDYVLSHIPQVEKDKLLIVGDSLTADIQGGYNAGIDTCWFNAIGAVNHTGISPMYEVRELVEVKKFV